MNFYIAIYGPFAIGPFQSKEDIYKWWKIQKSFGSSEPDDIKIYFVPSVP